MLKHFLLFGGMGALGGGAVLRFVWEDWSNRSLFAGIKGMSLLSLRTAMS